MGLCPRRKRPSSIPPWLKSPSTLLELQTLAKGGTVDDISRFAWLVDNLDLKPLKFPLTSQRGRVGYIPLIEDPLYTLCVFYLPEGARLPYHDHPRQHVAVRVLRGELQIESCDVRSVDGGVSYTVTGKKSQIIGCSSPATIVEPDNKNVHQIVAIKEAMFLDLVLPPYSPERVIKYFKKSEERLEPVSEREIGLDMDYCDVGSLIQSG